MAASHLKLLWKRVQDARAKWQHANNDVQAIDHDAAAPDGDYDHSHALDVELVAVKNYLSALEEFLAAVAPGPQKAVEDAGITPREREVLTLIAAGRSSKQIAKQLGISFKTVVTHRYNLQKKLKAHNTAELTKAALRMGLIEL